MKTGIKSKKSVGKIILTIILALLPLMAITIITFVECGIALGTIPSVLVGLGIGALVIPFFLVVTMYEGWNRKWYIWVVLLLVVALLFVIPFLNKGNGGENAPSMEGSPKGNARSMMVVGMINK